MMQDGKALQAGTSHNFGDKFARAFDVQYLSKEGKLEYCHETSWGVSTRLIGGIIMVHGDERGLVMPPRVAPIQAVILPIAAHKEGVAEGAQGIYQALLKAGIRAKLDDREGYSAGWKFNEWEMKGVPLRIEIGPRDLKTGSSPSAAGIPWRSSQSPSRASPKKSPRCLTTSMKRCSKRRALHAKPYYGCL
jgi:prolyl-tRNA synthetase